MMTIMSGWDWKRERERVVVEDVNDDEEEQKYTTY